MILPALGLAVSVTLACLSIGSTWTVPLAVFFGWLLLYTAADWRTRRLARELDRLLLTAYGTRRPRPEHKPVKEG